MFIGTGLQITNSGAPVTLGGSVTINDSLVLTDDVRVTQTFVESINDSFALTGEVNDIEVAVESINDSFTMTDDVTTTTVSGGGGSTFVPTDLFELAAWWSARDTSTIYEDAAGTDQAESNDDVLLVTDKSGNGHDLGQLFSVAVPNTGRTINGENAINHDNGDDEALVADGAIIDSAQAMVLVWAGVIDNAQPDTFPASLISEKDFFGPVYITLDTNALGFVWRGRDNSGSEASVLDVISSNNAFTTGSPVVLMMVWDGTTTAGETGSATGVHLYVNGSEVSYSKREILSGSIEFTTQGGAGNGPAIGGDRRSNPVGVFTDMGWTDVAIFLGNLTTAELNDVGEYFATPIGVTWTDIT